ncbi:MAG: ComEC family competence protein [Blastochloris sp.]|nr:ComEC family competence protein [Blastochloris sp.]
MRKSSNLILYPLFWLALMAGLGIGLARFYPQHPALILGAACLCLLGALFCEDRKAMWLLLPGSFFCFFFYAQVRDQTVEERDLRRVWEEEARSGVVELRVLDLPLRKVNEEREERLEFTGEALRVIDLQGVREVVGRLRVQVRNPGQQRFIPGQRVEVAGFWSRPAATRNPGEFDYRAFLENKRIFYLLKTNGNQVRELESGGDLLGHLAYHLREHMLAVLTLGLEEDPQISGLMAGMLFGYKEGITEDLEEAFRSTGTLHLFAVSGQNVGLILGIMILVLQVSGVLRWRWAWILLPLLLFLSGHGDAIECGAGFFDGGADVGGLGAVSSGVDLQYFGGGGTDSMGVGAGGIV